MPKIKKDSERDLWRTSIQIAGTRYFIKGKTREEVERRLGELLERRPNTRSTGKTLADVVAEFLREKETGNPDTFRHLLHHLTAAGTMPKVHGDAIFADLSVNDYALFLASRLQVKSKRGTLFSPVTINHERAAILQVVGFALRQRIITATSVTWQTLKKFPEPERPPRCLRDEELAALYGACPPEYKPLFDLFLYTGLRLSEGKRMRWDWVDLRNKTLTVKAAKTKKADTIPLCDAAIKAFEALPNRSGFVIEGNFGPILERNGIHSLLKSITRQAKLERFGLHPFRHTFITNVARATKNTMATEKLARHSDPKMTRRYMALAGEEFRPEIELLDARLGKLIEEGGDGKEPAKAKFRFRRKKEPTTVPQGVPQGTQSGSSSES